MLRIGKGYIVRKDGMSRLCADITYDDHEITLWFAVNISQEEYLSIGRADAFVMALLPMAMRENYDIVCEDPISERLLYQLNNYLIPTLDFEESCYHLIQINAPFTTKQYSSYGAIGTGFSGGIDSLYTIMRHNSESEYPITHLAIFNCGTLVFKHRNAFLESCQRARCFGEEQNLQVICVDTNLHMVLLEKYINVYTFRLVACTLALQGLFKMYLISSGPNAAECELDPKYCARYDLLTVNCVSTESLNFYLSGVETTRGKKLEALADWEPSWRWLHPCTRGIVGKTNCGSCKKCICDLTTLYALGKLERYKAVYDINEYLSHLPQRIGFVLAKQGSHSYTETQRLLKERNVPVSSAAYIYEKQFRRAIQYQEALK